jgi:uncharacterized membrane protein
MTLAPLLDASPAIQLHAFGAMTAFVLGVVQLSAPKGTLPHRTVGWIWVALMLAVSISAFWIHQLRLWGPWSPIHLLAIFTLVMLPLGVLVCPSPCRRTPSLDHDRYLRRRPGHRRHIHVRAGPNHVPSCVRPMSLPAT